MLIDCLVRDDEKLKHSNRLLTALSLKRSKKLFQERHMMLRLYSD